MSLMKVIDRTLARKLLIAFAFCATTLSVATPVLAQRLLGLDVSAYQGEITTTEWDTFKRPTNQQVGGISGDGRDFVIIRSSRGGTTGEDHRQGAYPSGNNTFFSQSERYDDPYFVQNITRATAAGLFAGAYHFARPDVIVGTVNSDGSTVAVANTGTDEANHFMQMAGPWMRPGYLPPMYDFEAGQSQRTAEQLAQFSIDFSNRIYQVMGIRPSIYINGSYNGTLASASAPLRDQIAQPPANEPSVVSPAYPTLVIARWPNQTNPGAIDVQNANPKDSFTPIYGPFDDYGTTHPWDFWQYASTMHLNGNNGGTSNTDVDVSHGDIESVKDQLIPAVWMNNSSGDWSTLANWNSGQAPIQPPVMSGQLTPLATGPLPAARLPGAAGTGPTAGQNDTVIIERPDENITVTLSSGTHNIRKMYMREALNITGGTLTINYDPNYVSDTVNYPNALRSGPISAQFSGAVSMSGNAALTVPALQVDASQTFTLAGGTLTFNSINMLASAKILVSGDVTLNPWNTSNPSYTSLTATFSGPSTSSIDLGGGIRTFNIGDGTSAVDVDIAVTMNNGGFTKTGPGTMRLSGETSFTQPVTINAGTLRLGGSSGLSPTQLAVVNNGGTFDMAGFSDGIAGLSSASGNTAGVVLQGIGNLSISGTNGTNTFGGTITGSGTLTKSGDSVQVFANNNSLGPVVINGGSLLFNGANTTGPIAVNSGGTLGGTGAVSGIVTVASGGHLAPGASIESLDMGGLTLNVGSVLDFELGPGGARDLLSVGGLLTLNGGSLHLTDTGGMGAGTYSLIIYGSLSGSVSNLGTPTGPAGYDYSLTDTGSSINLLVSAVPEPGCAALMVIGASMLHFSRHRNRRQKVGGLPA